MKSKVRSHWAKEVCGPRYGKDIDEQAVVDLERTVKERYRLEPYIPEFMDFKNAKGKKILEVGVGGGVDFSSWLKADVKAVGLDLTEAGVRLTKQRLTAPLVFSKNPITLIRVRRDTSRLKTRVSISYTPTGYSTTHPIRKRHLRRCIESSNKAVNSK